MADELARPIEEDPVRAAMNRALEEMRALTQRLIDMDVPPERTWLRNLLVGILNASRQNYRSVEIGALKLAPLASWGARNLLELRVITTYVLRSETDALSFKDDLAADLKEFWEAMLESSKSVHRRLVTEMQKLAESTPDPFKSSLLAKANEMEQGGPNLTGPVEEVATYRKLMEEFGIDPTRRPSSPCLKTLPLRNVLAQNQAWRWEPSEAGRNRRPCFTPANGPRHLGIPSISG